MDPDETLAVERAAAMFESWRDDDHDELVRLMQEAGVTERHHVDLVCALIGMGWAMAERGMP